MEVRIRDCGCPGAPHPDGDFVTMRDHLDLEGGLAVEAALIGLLAEGDPTTIEAKVPPTIGPLYVKHGAVGWNLVAEGGQPVPFDVGRLLDDYGLSRPLWDPADDLYSAEVLRPLGVAIQKSSPNGRTDVSTSANRASRRKRRQRSGRSSPGNSEAMESSAK